jgi:hypothetical protein
MRVTNEIVNQFTELGGRDDAMTVFLQPCAWEAGDWVEARADIQKVGGRLAFANAYLQVGERRIARTSAVFARVDVGGGGEAETRGLGDGGSYREDPLRGAAQRRTSGRWRRLWRLSKRALTLLV